MIFLKNGTSVFLGWGGGAHVFPVHFRVMDQLLFHIDFKGGKLLAGEIFSPPIYLGTVQWKCARGVPDSHFRWGKNLWTPLNSREK